VLLSTADEEVLVAAKELGEELQNAQQEQSQFEFNSLLMRCNDAIGREIGIDYGSACGAGDDCC
jgi:tetrahydromethanopterin S-methyltransferase subunit G